MNTADRWTPDPAQFIIVEGPDGCGKTTLAKFICYRTGAIRIHATAGGALNYAMWEYHCSLLQIAQEALEAGQSVVLDRHWPSEWCYSRALRPDIRSQAPYPYGSMQMAIAPLNPLYVFCLADMAYERMVEAGEHVEYTKEQFLQIISNFKELQGDMKNWNTPSRMVNYSFPHDGVDLATYVDRIMKRSA